MAGIHRDFTSNLQIKAIEGYVVKYFPGWFAHWALPPYLWAHFGTHGTFAYLRKPSGSGHARERKFQASCRLCWLSAHHHLENIGSTLSPFGLPGLSSSLGSKRCTFLICRYCCWRCWKMINIPKDGENGSSRWALAEARHTPHAHSCWMEAELITGRAFWNMCPHHPHGPTERGPGQALFYYISRAPLAFAGPRARIQMEAHTPCG